MIVLIAHVTSFRSRFLYGLRICESFKRSLPYYVNFFVLFLSVLTDYLHLFSNIMTSILKVQKANALNVQVNGKRKRKADAMDVEEGGLEVQTSKKKKNKQRVLLLSSRGITHRMRHLMNDLEALLPHVKKGMCIGISTVKGRLLIFF